MLCSKLGLFFLPSIMPTLGITGLFAVFALLDLAALSVLSRLPYRHERLGRVPGAPMEWHVLMTRTSVACLFGIGMFEAYNMAQFTYVERMGQSLGLDGGEIGLALGVSTLLGIPGGFGVTWLGARFGHFKPIAAAIAAQAFALLLLLYGSGMPSYFIALCFLGFAWDVVQGRGVTTVGRETPEEMEWGERDFLYLPPWAWHKHENLSKNEPAIVFSVNDRPVLEALGLWREENG